MVQHQHGAVLRDQALHCCPGQLHAERCLVAAGGGVCHFRQQELTICGVVWSVQHTLI